MIESPFLGVEVIHESYEDVFIESVVSKPFPDMGPVFLFYMGVIILMIGSASGKLDGVIPLSEVSHQGPVKEFGAVIAVKAEQGEGEGVFDILDLS